MAAIVKYDNVEILRKELVVLKKVSFEIEEGQFVFLIGKVGSGKSSLLKTIYAEIGIENGGIVLKGQKIFDIKPFSTLFYKSCTLFIKIAGD